MYKPVPKKNSSWTPTPVQKKGKSPDKLGHFSIQPKSNPSSAPSQEIGEYKRSSVDRLAANVMRRIQAKEQEQAEGLTLQSKSASPWAPTFDAPPPLAQSPASQLKGAFAPVSENPIQRQCADCAKEEEEQKDLEEIGIQTKLTIGAPGDPYEQEADRVASQVMSMSAPPDSSASVQRQLDTNHPHHPHQIWKRAQSITPVVQRLIDPRVQMRQMIQRAAQIDGNQASGDLESRLNASKGGGSPLSEEVRGFMEPRFGADFSGVRVHTGSEAVQMNQELGAQAFTHGSDVYFGAGKSPGNNELTAHELVHVEQQTGHIIQRKYNPAFSELIQRNLLLGPQPNPVQDPLTPEQEEDLRHRRYARLSGRNYELFARSATRFEFTPTHPNGRTLYFFFGFVNSQSDQQALETEAPFIEDDVIHAANSGFRVIYDLQCTEVDFGSALYNPASYGIYWSGHGDLKSPGGIVMSNRQRVAPESVDPSRVSTNLRYFILAACYSAMAEQRWRAVLPTQCQFEGWVNLTNTAEAEDFTSTAPFGDDLSSHGGLHPERELRDYIEDAGS